MPKIFVFGFPGKYGGAATEMYHQILLWLKMKIEVHLIPAWDPEHEDLFPVIKKTEVIIHTPLEWYSLSPDDAIIGYCSDLFLFYLPSIRKYTHRIIFINCMTFLFEEEKKALKCGYIKILLYQNKKIMSTIKREIDKLCLTNKIETMSIIPYFHEDDFVFHKNRDEGKFVCGHISRIDEKKFAKGIVPIYEGVISPVPKKGIFLGYGSQIEEKIGKLPNWIMTAQSHYSLSTSEFYRACDVILQPSDSIENWPRIGFEAMATGSILIVDNRGGWKQMVKHGQTGWLCNSTQDFIHYASLMAENYNLRQDMAMGARERGRYLANEQSSAESWLNVFSKIFE